VCSSWAVISRIVVVSQSTDWDFMSRLDSWWAWDTQLQLVGWEGKWALSREAGDDIETDTDTQPQKLKAPVGSGRGG